MRHETCFSRANDFLKPNGGDHANAISAANDASRVCCRAAGDRPRPEDLTAFYKGKSINLYIGAAVGGGYDAYARLLGRHIGKYIPGNPNVIPINMPGAS